MSRRLPKPKQSYAITQPKAFNNRSLRISRSDAHETYSMNIPEGECLRNPNRTILKIEESKC